MKELPEGANQLYYSSSPYLKQHAQNPVNWYPWGEEALERAKKEDKPIIVSIGYSSCHWCHVMERESFENDSIAQIMNEHFISIKVDREERPDIDQIYMEAVQAMGMQGGWPLNVFLTPDQKPFYGGTYFPPKNWATLLTNIQEAFKSKRAEIDESADKLADAVSVSELLKYKLKAGEVEYKKENLDSVFTSMKVKFDTIHGGFNRSPKFPMPVNWQFLLDYSESMNNKEAVVQVERTLLAMANGGIYDQIGGGFARYSTDSVWLVPHFEKMLYDNGQLLALYSEAFKKTGNARFREIVYQTVEWLEREMLHENGGFYSALDADSEGVEGKYYVWNYNEVERLLGSDTQLIAEFYTISNEGNWEDVNILHRKEDKPDFAKRHNMSVEEFETILNRSEKTLLTARQDRIAPGLDNKILAGWNGIMTKGLISAYEAFGEEKFLELAVGNADYIRNNLIKDQRLLRLTPDNNQEIYAYLEDYAFVIDALIALYEVTFNDKWLHTANDLTAYCIANFLDENEDMFFYTDSEKLIARKKEIFDNVIPASNSQMAINLYKLGLLLDNESYSGLSDKMLGRIQPMITSDAAYLSNWARLYGFHASPTAEIAIVGNEAMDIRKKFSRIFLPNSIFMGSENPKKFPVLIEGKTPLNDKTTIYVCFNKSCKLPVHTIEEALKQLH